MEQENVAITMFFFFTNFCRGKRKLKRFHSQKTLQKVGRLGDHINDHAFYGLVMRSTDLEQCMQ